MKILNQTVAFETETGGHTGRLSALVHCPVMLPRLSQSYYI